MNKSKRLAIIVLALGGVGCSGLLRLHGESGAGGCARVRRASRRAVPPGGFAVAVEVARVAASDFSDERVRSATLSRTSRSSCVQETAGRIAAINFRDGAIVTRGTVLVTLDAAVQRPNWRRRGPTWRWRRAIISAIRNCWAGNSSASRRSTIRQRHSRCRRPQSSWPRRGRQDAGQGAVRRHGRLAQCQRRRLRQGRRLT